MSKYLEQLKDPRWQKKRLEIMQRDNFTCQRCEDTESTLIVHHKDYSPNTEPWNYSDDLLITLCEECHEEVKSNYSSEVEQLIIHELRRLFWGDDLCNIYVGFKKIPTMTTNDSWMLSEVIQWFLSTPEIRKELTLRVGALMRGGRNG